MCVRRLAIEYVEVLILILGYHGFRDPNEKLGKWIFNGSLCLNFEEENQTNCYCLNRNLEFHC